MACEIWHFPFHRCCLQGSVCSIQYKVAVSSDHLQLYALCTDVTTQLLTNHSLLLLLNVQLRKLVGSNSSLRQRVVGYV
jgi:hypothetical protein